MSVRIRLRQFAKGPYAAASMGDTARFFGKRGELSLKRDRSAHRRYAYLYEDMLT